MPRPGFEPGLRPVSSFYERAECLASTLSGLVIIKKREYKNLLMIIELYVRQ